MIIGRQEQKIKKYVIEATVFVYWVNVEQRRESLVTVASSRVFFFFLKNVKATGEVKNIIPSTYTLEVYVPVRDKLISRDWYDSCHLEISFLIIGDAVAGWRILPISLPISGDGNTIPPAIQSRGKLLFVSYPYPSVRNPIHVTVSISLQSPSTSYRRLCHHLGSCHHRLSPGLLLQPGWLSCLYTCLPMVSLQHGSQHDPVEVSDFVFLWSEPFGGFPPRSVKTLFTNLWPQWSVFSDPLLCLWPHFSLLSLLLILFQSHLPSWIPSAFAVAISSICDPLSQKSLSPSSLCLNAVFLVFLWSWYLKLHLLCPLSQAL